MTSSHTLPDPTSTASATAAPERIRCTSTADFLAALPRLVGFTAPDSLFLVLFTGAQAHSALRVDLPDTEDPAALSDYLDDLELLLGRARTLHGPSAPAIAISSSLSFEEAGGPPWQALATLLFARLQRAHAAPRELCCLAPDGWVSYLDPLAPRRGRPLSEIAASSAAAPSAPPALTELGVFRRVPAAEREAVAQAFTAIAAAPERSDRATSRAEITRLFTPEPLTPTETARLLGALRTDAGWAATFDELARGASVSAPRMETREALTEALPAGTRHATMPARQTQHAVMAGLRAASEHLAFLVPLASRASKPALIALSALAWWVRGLESVARRQIEEALTLDPHHEVARLAKRVIEHGSFPTASAQE
ncbi:DUF4192 family protein [Leucobacter sp. G161]|uniref:DUF4192 family protein n=1 Tax=Leucobacter sp. G161 TaxID=663704 RepID=UPI00073D0E45|nr:DUF4192 family protein [Leucobacter sp. G161]KUF05868.1 hypothetical protein AUL38_03365 [Leucobacter sp. G161]